MSQISEDVNIESNPKIKHLLDQGFRFVIASENGTVHHFEHPKTGKVAYVDTRKKVMKEAKLDESTNHEMHIDPNSGEDRIRLLDAAEKANHKIKSERNEHGHVVIGFSNPLAKAIFKSHVKEKNYGEIVKESLDESIPNQDPEGFSPVGGDEKKFAALHKVEDIPDANGNGDDVFKGTAVDYFKRAAKRMGYDKGEDRKAAFKVSKDVDNPKKNKTTSLMKQVVPESEQLDEISKKTLVSYNDKATKDRTKIGNKIRGKLVPGRLGAEWRGSDKEFDSLVDKEQRRAKYINKARAKIGVKGRVWESTDFDTEMLAEDFIVEAHHDLEEVELKKKHHDAMATYHRQMAAHAEHMMDHHAEQHYNLHKAKSKYGNEGAFGGRNIAAEQKHHAERQAFWEAKLAHHTHKVDRHDKAWEAASNVKQKLYGESVEELDEISKGKLGQYLKKAKSEYGFAALDAGSYTERNPHKQWPDRIRRTIDKRSKRINKAVDRLTKESEEANEAATMSLGGNQSPRNFIQSSVKQKRLKGSTKMTNVQPPKPGQNN